MKKKTSSRGKSIRKKLPRLPSEIVEILRKKGGAQGTKKGKRGYKRPRNKVEIKKADMNSDNEDISAFYFFIHNLFIPIGINGL